VIRIKFLKRRGRQRNYARRQQYRRLSRAGRLGLTSLAATALGLLVASSGAVLPGGLLVAVAGVVALRARRWLVLARRSSVGARSEDEVRDALAALQDHGWRLRHGLRWPGGGDIDSVAIAPTGVGFARRRPGDINSTIWTGCASRLGRSALAGAGGAVEGRFPFCASFAQPESTATRRGVLVVSIDRLLPVLWDVAGGVERGRLTPLGGRWVA
jgi:hypothetical protein